MDHAPHSGPIADWAADARAQGRADETVKLYRSCLVRLEGAAQSVGLLRVTEEDVVRFLADRRPASKVLHAKAFHAFFGWAVETGRTAKDPSARIHPKPPPLGPPDAYSEAELGRVVSAARSRDPLRGWAILACYGLGLRRRELVRLTPSDVDFENGRVHVRESKGGKSRYVEMSGVAERALRELRPWWNGTILGGVTGIQFSRWVYNAATAAGLPSGRRRAHMLRSAYATRLRRAGARIEVVQGLLGHASIATTQRYFAVEEEERRATVRLLDL